jgi:hypothetical protein
MRLSAAASVVILLITTHHTAASTLPRRTLHELFGDGEATFAHLTEVCVRVYLLGTHAIRFSALTSRSSCTAAVAGVPRGYLRVGHRDNGYSLTETRAAGDQGHETVMFTAEGGVFTKT